MAVLGQRFETAALTTLNVQVQGLSSKSEETGGKTRENIQKINTFEVRIHTSSKLEPVILGYIKPVFSC